MKKLVKCGILMLSFFAFFLTLNINSKVHAEEMISPTNDRDINKVFERIQKQQNAGRKLTEFVVAIIGDGIDQNHALLKDRLITPMDCTSSQCIEAPNQVEGENGTFAAGIIVANTLNNVKILSLKVTDENGKVNAYAFNAAAQYILNSNARIRIANMAVQTSKSDTDCHTNNTLYQSAINDLILENIPFISPAGDNGKDVSDNCSNVNKHVIIVADSKSENSNTGELIDFYMPGKDIVSFNVGGGTTTKSGSEFSTAYMSSAIALLHTSSPSTRINKIVDELDKCYSVFEVDKGIAWRHVSIDYQGAGNGTYTINGEANKKYSFNASALANKYRDPDDFICYEGDIIDLKVVGRSGPILLLFFPFVFRQVFKATDHAEENSGRKLFQATFNYKVVVSNEYDFWININNYVF